jgi:hypothetical protein
VPVDGPVRGAPLVIARHRLIAHRTLPEAAVAGRDVEIELLRPELIEVGRLVRATTELNVATASTSVPPAVASEEIVSQSMPGCRA